MNKVYEHWDHTWLFPLCTPLHMMNFHFTPSILILDILHSKLLNFVHFSLIINMVKKIDEISRVHTMHGESIGQNLLCTPNLFSFPLCTHKF